MSELGFGRLWKDSLAQKKAKEALPQRAGRAGREDGMSEPPSWTFWPWDWRCC